MTSGSLGVESDPSYTGELIGMLELVWGEGWLSPGGPEEVDLIIEGLDLRGRHLLDIGCAVGGIDFYLVEKHRVGHVTGIDVEAPVLKIARSRAAERRLDDRIDFQKVEPGPLPFAADTFDVVFSKDAMVHIPDKETLAHDIFRVLKPGGILAASDWMIGHDGAPSAEMQHYIDLEHLGFGMGSPDRYRRALQEAGFIDIVLTDRNYWYRQVARNELAAMTGEIYGEAVSALGREFVDRNIEIWEAMLIVLDKGEHRPTQLRACKP